MLVPDKPRNHLFRHVKICVFRSLLPIVRVQCGKTETGNLESMSRETNGKNENLLFTQVQNKERDFVHESLGIVFSIHFFLGFFPPFLRVTMSSSLFAWNSFYSYSSLTIFPKANLLPRVCQHRASWQRKNTENSMHNSRSHRIFFLLLVEPVTIGHKRILSFAFFFPFNKLGGSVFFRLSSSVFVCGKNRAKIMKTVSFFRAEQNRKKSVRFLVSLMWKFS